MFNLIPSDYRNLVIIRVDGGICSQIKFFALGRFLGKQGYHIKYDLSWFRTNGKDLTGQFDRNWDIPKAFPDVHVEEASVEEVSYFRRHFRRRGENAKSYAPPLYVDGNPFCGSVLHAQLPDLQASFEVELDAANSGLLAEIEGGTSCAVHARRGDLANGGFGYGKATSVEYYRRAMLFVSALYPGIRFFLFSDEPEWAREKLLPLIPKGSTGKICAANGSERGYADLFLISRCTSVISSIGSLGIMGALLSRKNELLVLSKMGQTAPNGTLRHVCFLPEDADGRMPAGIVDGLEVSFVERRLHGFGWMVFRLWRRLGMWLCDRSVDIRIPPRCN